jgi:hypothetical protein
MTDMLARQALEQAPSAAPASPPRPLGNTDSKPGGHASVARGGVTMDTVKQVSKSPEPTALKAGFPGDAAGRRARIRRAIKANAETLRRLAR